MSKRVSYLDYQAIDAANWSTIKYLDESPLHYKWHLEHDREETPGLLKGLAAHTAILDPDNFMRHYVLCELNGRRGNAWKDFQALHEGKTILFEAEYQLALNIRDAVVGNVNKGIAGNARARELLAGCETEKTIVWTDPTTGIKCKSRLDALNDDLIEIKSTARLQPHLWQQTAARMKYHAQMAMQREGVMCSTGRTPRGCYIIAVESSPPHDVGVFYYGPDELERGADLFHELLHKLKWCREANAWPGRYSEEMHLELPAWVYADDEHAEMQATVVGDSNMETW